MEVFSKYFTRLVAGNAPQIFPGLNRPVANPGNYHILVGEMRKIAHDADQATKIAESVESGTEDIFRDFDLSTFMEHFKLDALEKTLLALAFKLGSRPDLKTKGMARKYMLCYDDVVVVLCFSVFCLFNPLSLRLTICSQYSGCYPVDQLPHFHGHHLSAGHRSPR